MGPIDLKFYFSIFLRRLPYFVVVAGFVCAIGLSVAVMLPPKYVSTASILVESEQIPSDLAASTVGVAATEQIQIIEQRLMTRNNLLDLARKMRVYANRPDMTASEIVENMRSRTAFERLNFGRDGAVAFTISFSASDPNLASSVANEFVTLVLQENVRLRTGRATETLEFFEDDVKRLGEDLSRMSRDILAFKNANAGALPDSLDYRRNEQSRTQERLLQLEREETALRDTRARMVALWERTGSLGEASGRNMTDEERELDSLKKQLEQQLILFSETNPKITLLKGRIAALEQVVAQQRAAAGQQEGETQLTELDIQLQEIDGRLGYIDTEQARLEAQLADLTKSIEATPQNELELGALERAFQTTQAQYESAVARLAAAQTGERIELLSKGERFSVIEQATPQDRPDSPNRPLIALGSVVAGLAAGGALILLLEFLNRSIRRPVELTAKLGIQPFGTVPYMRTRRETVTKRAIIGSLLGTFVVAVPVAIWALHTYYLPLDLLIRNVIDKIGLQNYLSALL